MAAWTTIIGKTPGFAGEQLWLMKQALVQNSSWGVPRSSDGNTVWDNSSDVLQSANVYYDRGSPGNMEGPNCWFELRWYGPGVQRSFLFFGGADTWTIWYAALDSGFDGGSPDLTTPPTATNQQYLLNDPNTNPSPRPTPAPHYGYAAVPWLTKTLVTPADSAYPVLPPCYVDVIVDGDSTKSGAFFFGVRKTGSQGYLSVLALDTLNGIDPSDDPDPAVVVLNIAYGSNGDANSASPLFAAADADPVLKRIQNPSPNGTYQVGCCVKFYGSGPSFMVAMCFLGGWNGTADQYVPRVVTPNSSSDASALWQEMPVFYYLGNMGQSNLFRSLTFNFEIFHLRADKQRINLGWVTMPWDGTTKPIY